ncbi:putative ribosomal protein in infB 5'region [Pediococcus pentosaceus]|uniref:Putative ribosomal protein in infB 5'region n=1 Tax=Pediococcus pentosaceus TaxID=1255 RepID=A0A1Y0VNX7_PEDPE|nr:putative ribosomal protein in infB 5'region [Pediococcus pentosaceus]
MIKENISKYLGLMRRSGNLVTGQELVLSSIRSQKAKFVLVTEDIGESSKKKIIDKCHFTKFHSLFWELKKIFPKQLGRKDR